MEQTQEYEKMGGIARVVIHPALAPLPESAEQGGEQLKIEPTGSFYKETVERREGQRIVVHHLEIVTSHINLPLSDEVLASGVVFDIQFQSGRWLRIGWSEALGVLSALKLSECVGESGARRLDYPLKRWVFESIDFENKL